MLVGMTATLRFLAAFLACSLLAACGGAGHQCASFIAIAAVPPPMLISPANGSTGVPVTGASVEVSYDPPSGALHLVAQGTGAVVLGGPFTPATGNVTTVPGAVVSALPTLAAHTTYTVFVDAVLPPPPPCSNGNGGPASYSLGTFTTQ